MTSHQGGNWPGRHRFAVDASWSWLAAGLVGIFPAQGIVLPDVSYSLLAHILAICCVVPLAWRRTRPLMSATAIAVVALAQLIAGYPLILPANLAIMVSLFSLTVYGPPWARWAGIAAASTGAVLLGITALMVMPRHFPGLSSRSFLLESAALATFSLLFALVTWAFALLRRNRRTLIDALHDKTRRLEVERDQQAHIATAAERARIAREMHDIVAHSLTVIIAQSDGGRYAATSDPQAGLTALQVVADTARSALADMRRLLGVLRQDGDAPAPRAPLAPLTFQVADASGLAVGGAGTCVARTPGTSGAWAGAGAGAGGAGTGQASTGGASSGKAYGLGQQIAELVSQSQAAGMKVSLTAVGQARPLPGGAALTVQRICQEALTNVRKHAGPQAHVAVTLLWQPDRVGLEVTDNGGGLASTGSQLANTGRQGGQEPGRPGYGLLGMKERAAMYSGTLTAGPRQQGGWQVRLSLPV